MTLRLTDLTDGHLAAMAGHVERWTDQGQRVDPVDRDHVEQRLRACYAHTVLAWPGQVVHVDNPVVLTLAAPIAASVLGDGRPAAPAFRAALVDPVRDALSLACAERTTWPVFEGVAFPVGRGVRPAVPRLVTRGDVPTVVDALRESVVGAVRAACPRVPARVVDDAVAAGLDHRHPERLESRIDSWVRDGASLMSARRLLERCAVTSYLRDVCGVRLDGDLPDRDRALAAMTTAAAAWWPHNRFVMVCDRPRQVHAEEFGSSSAVRSHRLHRADGPAITWGSGWGLSFWHGTPVPVGIDSWSVQRILAEENTEIRRMAIERLGWDRFVRDAGLQPVGPPAPDPGNPGRRLRLYDIPVRLYDTPVSILICENGSRDRDGTRRSFGLTVPASIRDPIAAAAWTYDVDPTSYAALARRT